MPDFGKKTSIRWDQPFILSTKTCRGLSRAVGHRIPSFGTPYDWLTEIPRSFNKDHPTHAPLRPSDPLRMLMTRPPLSYFLPHMVLNASALSASLPPFPCQSGSTRPTTTASQRRNTCQATCRPCSSALSSAQPCHQPIPRIPLPYASRGR